MRVLNFAKENDGIWYIVFPEWPGEKSDLAMVQGADKLLDRLSQGGTWVKIQVVLAPMDGFYRLRLIEHTPDIGGALYKTYEGSSFPETVWLCDVTKFVFDGYMPREIYFKTL